MRTPEEIACFKALVIDYVASGEMTITEAVCQLQVGWQELRRWRKHDAAFAEELGAAMEYLTEVKADSILKIHDEVPDPKRALVALAARKWWTEKRNPKTFGEKAQLTDSNPLLLDILKAAIARTLADRLALPPPIELKAD